MNRIYAITFLGKLDYSLAFKSRKEAHIIKRLLYNDDPDAEVVELEIKDIAKEMESESNE